MKSGCRSARHPLVFVIPFLLLSLFRNSSVSVASHRAKQQLLTTCGQESYGKAVVKVVSKAGTQLFSHAGSRPARTQVRIRSGTHAAARPLRCNELARERPDQTHSSPVDTLCALLEACEVTYFGTDRAHLPGAQPLCV